ncbi:MAG: hypothetical protein K6T17_00140 [Fimbriimonadales bacterium]|nr:hypothetical protein [Fimbriimonadales bacterium]
MKRITSSLALLALSLALGAQQRVDEEYTKKIREYTTEPFFLTELVDYLPAGNGVPTPRDVLGYVIGTPRILTYTADINRYMRALDAASPRVLVETMGRSEEGREMILVVISDEDNIRNLSRYKQINARLTDPRTLKDEQEAESLIQQVIPIYYTTGGLHSPETGSPEMLMELAYRLATDEKPFFQAIRKNCIVLITPVLETDGRDRYVDTYLYRVKNPDKPPIPLIYWGHYVAHDNNRDGIALSLALSQNLMRKWLEYKPQVMHDLHESATYLYISTGTGPYNAWLDPITVEEWHLMAYHEINELTRRGVPGVWTHDFYDGWAPHYLFYAANGHNAIGRFYETFGGFGADTGIRPGTGATTRTWFRPNPAFPQVWWSFRNNINLQQSALLLGLYFVATNKERFMRNYYLKCKRAVQKPYNEGPSAYIFPADEPRKAQQAHLLQLLQRQGVEIHQLNEEVRLGDQTFPKGSYVVRMDQPYSRMADMLLDTQYYSPNDPRPYDDTGWTLGPLFNVKTIRITDNGILKQPMTLIPGLIQPSGELRGPDEGEAIVIKPNGDFALAQLRYRMPEAEIYVTEEPFNIGERMFPRGTILISLSSSINGRAPSRKWASILSELGLTGDVLAKKPSVKMRPLRAARIAILHTWQNTQDEGWFRLAFDKLGIPYTYISVHEIRDNPNLREKYDVIVFPPTRGTPQSIVNGIPKSGEPIPWKPLSGFPHLGGPDTTDNIRGGIELIGMVHLQKFLERGGLLICVGSTCEVPITYGLVSGVSVAQTQNLVVVGSVLKALAATEDSPVLFGYDPTLGVYFSRGPVFRLGGGGGGRGFGAGAQASQGRPSGRGSLTDPDIPQGRPLYRPGTRPELEALRSPSTPSQDSASRPQVILRFAEAQDLLVSGLLTGAEELAGTPAVVLCPVGEGNVLLFAINPFWRMETHGSFMLLFNAVMNFDRLRATE